MNKEKFNQIVEIHESMNSLLNHIEELEAKIKVLENQKTNISKDDMIFILDNAKSNMNFYGIVSDLESDITFSIDSDSSGRLEATAELSKWRLEEAFEDTMKETILEEFEEFVIQKQEKEEVSESDSHEEVLSLNES